MLRDFFLPGKAEDDPSFNQEIRHRALRGLYIIAGVLAFLPWMGRLFHILANYFDPQPMPVPVIPLALLALSGLVLATIRTQWGRTHPRGIGLSLGPGVAAIIALANLKGGSVSAEPTFSSLMDLTVVLIVALAAIPARPVQMLAFGWGIAFINFSITTFLVRQGQLASPSMHYFAGFDMIVLLCGVLAGVNYRLLHESYLAQQSRLASQSRLLNAETAVSFSRLSATLSHELNSPLGALSSSVSSLQKLADKEDKTPEADRERIRGLRRELLNGSEKAVNKISAVIGRIQRFTNLDRAEVTQVRVDGMLQDVAQMVRTEAGEEAEITLRAEELPVVTLKPQPISGVLSRLLHNAVKASAGRGPVEVQAARQIDHILVTIQDHGDGLSSQELGELFQPGFKTRAGRVETSKWGLFTARQVIREHGGDILAARAEGSGTKITVSLPLDTPLRAS